jgi:hypothetical protein
VPSSTVPGSATTPSTIPGGGGTSIPPR